jgi:hypothetical protein
MKVVIGVFEPLSDKCGTCGEYILTLCAFIIIMNIIFIMGPFMYAQAHSILGCDKSPILLEGKENGRWPTLSKDCVKDAQSKTC